MEIFNFTDIFIDVTNKARKIPKGMYLECGKYPIIDQGKNSVAGYCDDITGIYNEVPAIVFGDHTLVLKYIEEPLFIGADGVKLLKCKFKDVNYKYLYYSLCSLKIENTGYNRHFKYLKEKKIYLPPLESQENIARNLELANELVKLHKIRLEELDKLIQSVFYDMFGDPVTNEMGWEIDEISKIADVATGCTPNRGIVEFYGGNIPWVKTGEISKGYITETEEYITDFAIKETNCKLFPKNTILTAMYGQGKTRGTSGMIKTEACTNQACSAIIPNNNFNCEFLYRQLQIRYEELRLLGRGGNQTNLNLTMIKEFVIILPPLVLQEKFADIVIKIENQKTQVERALNEMEILYSSLMQLYFK